MIALNNIYELLEKIEKKRNELRRIRNFLMKKDKELCELSRPYTYGQKIPANLEEENWIVKENWKNILDTNKNWDKIHELKKEQKCLRRMTTVYQMRIDAMKKRIEAMKRIKAMKQEEKKEQVTQSWKNVLCYKIV